jgi:hypothetical protein
MMPDVQSADMLSCTTSVAASCAAHAQYAHWMHAYGQPCSALVALVAAALNVQRCKSMTQFQEHVRKVKQYAADKSAHITQKIVAVQRMHAHW